ncbi:hypothetical protein Agabi119p4_9305 [Agaricus bisporus var. burnettii]|uniref:Uncharacterized protein n=1 Tax=Agaricus bisporus var. burnettii TaxID=192524 RepID=A0A8H7C5M3_AGABI|nr:hypothetical protein Agabi119p4_9305 [Agaricus bisporus var. burnettii]
MVIPKGDKKAAKEHHHELEHDIVASGDETVHFITGWHIPEEIPDPILGRRHSQVGYAAMRRGNTISQKTLPAGRRATATNAIGWAALLALIKTFKLRRKDETISTLRLYTTSPGTIRNLIEFSNKPSGHSMSIALATAFEDIFDAYPDFSIEVWGYSLNAFKDCEKDHRFLEFCVPCNFVMNLPTYRKDVIIPTHFHLPGYTLVRLRFSHHSFSYHFLFHVTCYIFSFS